MKINEIYYAAIIDNEICGDTDCHLIYSEDYNFVQEHIKDEYNPVDGMIKFRDGTKSLIQIKKVRLVYDED